MMDSIYVDSLQIWGTGTVSNYVLEGFKGLGNPTPRANRRDRSRRHGVIDLSTYYTSRTWTGTMWIMADASTPEDWDSFWTAYDTFMETLGYGVPGKTLTFTRKGLTYSEYCEITVDVDMEPEFPNPSAPLCKVPLEWVAADPRLYATALQDINFASSGNASNGGNFSSAPLIRFNGAGTNPGIENASLSTENELNILYTMIGGDEIEVDCLARTVKLNGALRPDILDASNSFFFSLRKGTNTLNKLGGAASIDVEWHDARIG